MFHSKGHRKVPSMNEDEMLGLGLINCGHKQEPWTELSWRGG